MMEFKGTKKWFLDTDGCLKDENFDVVADFLITDEKDIVNAKLASKAPEMLEMLKIINEGINTMDFTQLEVLQPEIEQLIKEATTL